MVYSLGQLPGVVTSLDVSEGVPQLSVAEGVVHAGVPVHSMDEGPGSPLITGGVVSSTLNVCVATVVLPHASVAVQVLVIVYSFGQLPGVVASLEERVAAPQLSVAVGVVHVGVPEHSIDTGAGNALITGGVVSSILKVCVATAVFPQASVAVQVRVMEYLFVQLPGVVTSADVRDGVPQLSVAVGVLHVGVPVHSIDIGPGNPLITGGVVSSTVNTCDATAVFPQASVAVHVRVMV